MHPKKTSITAHHNHNPEPNHTPNRTLPITLSLPITLTLTMPLLYLNHTFSSIAPLQVISEIDPPGDLFRAQLVCEALNTCGAYYVRGQVSDLSA